MNGIRKSVEMNGNHKKEQSKSSPYSIPEKQFVNRESLLTILSENSNVQILKNIFIASVLWLLITVSVQEYQTTDSIQPGFLIIAGAFGKIHVVSFLWIIHNLITIGYYYFFVWWANIRIGLLPKSTFVKIWDTSLIIVSLIHYILQIVGTSMTVQYFQLAKASALIACSEQTRLLMKTHAFLRTNFTKVRNFKPHSDEKLKIAPLRHFIYFLFAPTLIYRDEYPRTKSIRWNFVGYRLFEFFVMIFFLAFIFEIFFIPSVKQAGIEQYSLLKIFLIMCNNGIIGFALMLSIFYSVLHTTQNFFAELLRFGDREFYRDWWKSTSFSIFFRKWNLVVSDWLHTYIFKEFYENITPGNKLIGKLAVFLISALVHEWIITEAAGFFFPALFFVFLFSGTFVAAVEISHSIIANILLWSGLLLGPGWLLTMYFMEFFIRINVPLNGNEEDPFTPRLLDIIQ